MFYQKAAVVLAFITITLSSCTDSKPTRYVIAESKSYEASLFRQNCAICHGPEAMGKTLDDGRIIPNIRDGEHKYKTPDEIYNHIANGGNGMVPFRDMLTKREIDLLVAFVINDLRRSDNNRR
ncbi:MAG: cytochrome c [Pyrinomonadaceae bacterium]|nr:cytochrome c [Pyrinomonadaceae bacterium]MBP6213714.1 cytochrome c [Pyrinomonadaceae bacterium]